jgi:nicotinamidase-related amidase
MLVDKPTYSAFEAAAFRSALAALDADTLIVSGVETDSCVLATLFGAVDRGFRVIAAADAMASGSPAAHAAVFATLLPRLGQQVEVATTAEILAAWGGSRC